MRGDGNLTREALLEEVTVEARIHEVMSQVWW